MLPLPLFEDQSSETNPFSITDVTNYIRKLLDGDASLNDVWVEGEVSNLSRPSSGHLYFTLKDTEAQLRCVIWRSEAENIGFDLADHDQILAHGKISVYEKGGIYQLYARRLVPIGAGDLNRQLQLLHMKLKEEGLFEEALKQPIPRLPTRIGVVTSASTAAFQDVLNVLRRRLPLAQIILSPTPVQGRDAPPQIIAALQRLVDYGELDVIIMVRGGGSLEDLWCFNDEHVVRAVVACPIPIVCGVGHEIDNTLVDFAADFRAPTPSAAAEVVATPDLTGLLAGIEVFKDRAYNAIETKKDDLEKQLFSQKRAVKHLSPAASVYNARQRVDEVLDRMALGMQIRLGHSQNILATGRATLRSNDPMGILARGYAIVSRRGDGKRLTSAGDAAPGVALHIQLHDGTLEASVRSRTLPDAQEMKPPNKRPTQG